MSLLVGRAAEAFFREKLFCFCFASFTIAHRRAESQSSQRASRQSLKIGYVVCGRVCVSLIEKACRIVYVPVCLSSIRCLFVCVLSIEKPCVMLIIDREILCGRNRDTWTAKERQKKKVERRCNREDSVTDWPASLLTAYFVYFPRNYGKNDLRSCSQTGQKRKR